MFYQFEASDNIEDYLEAIKGREEFIVKKDEENGYGVINYVLSMEDTFPDPNLTTDSVLKRNYILRRDCRGLKFSLLTGKIISKPYHKFFNLNERAEVDYSKIDFAQPHIILEKLDGSMITPMILDKVRWGTKMGLTGVAKPVEDFVSNKSHYEDFARYFAGLNQTPIFEWCSRQQRIVIDYPEERLVLTGIRDNYTGEYTDYESMLKYGNSAGIPVVKALPGSITNIHEFMKQARDLKGEEGYVIRFPTLFLKIKGEEYCMLHKTIDQLRLEKDCLRLILNEKVDDAKAFLTEELRDALDRFTADIYHNIRQLAEKIYWEAVAAYDNLNGSKKRFALEYVNVSDFGKKYSKFLYKSFDNIEGGVEIVYNDLISHILLNTNSQTKVDANRHIFGDCSWYNYSRVSEIDLDG
jgi:RNA ligase